MAVTGSRGREVVFTDDPRMTLGVPRTPAGVLPVPSIELVQCPACRETNSAIDVRCHQCGLVLALYIGPPPAIAPRFGLGTLMLLIALAGLGFGVTRAVPALGILILVVGLPAVVRTLLVASRRRADGRPFTIEEKLGTLLGSVAVVLAIGVPALIAFGVCGAFGMMLADLLLPRPIIGRDVAAAVAVVLGLVSGLGGSILVVRGLGRVYWMVEDA